MGEKNQLMGCESQSLVTNTAFLLTVLCLNPGSARTQHEVLHVDVMRGAGSTWQQLLVMFSCRCTIIL